MGNHLFKREKTSPGAVYFNATTNETLVLEGTSEDEWEYAAMIAFLMGAGIIIMLILLLFLYCCLPCFCGGTNEPPKKPTKPGRPRANTEEKPEAPTRSEIAGEPEPCTKEPPPPKEEPKAEVTEEECPGDNREEGEEPGNSSNGEDDDQINDKMALKMMMDVLREKAGNDPEKLRELIRQKMFGDETAPEPDSEPQNTEPEKEASEPEDKVYPDLPSKKPLPPCECDGVDEPLLSKIRIYESNEPSHPVYHHPQTHAAPPPQNFYHNHYQEPAYHHAPQQQRSFARQHDYCVGNVDEHAGLLASENHIDLQQHEELADHNIYDEAGNVVGRIGQPIFG